MDTKGIRMVRPLLAYEEPDNPWLRLYFDDVEFPDGTPGRFNRVELGPRGRGPGVIIVPVFPDGRLLFMRIFRYPAQRWMVDMPRGGGEVGVEPIHLARQELQEETGLDAEEFKPIGHLYIDAGLRDDLASVFLAIQLSGEIKPNYEGEAIAEILPFSLTEVDSMIRSGEITDSISIAALALARPYISA